MSKCKNPSCGSEFIPCANNFSEKLGRWGTYACCENCANIYISLIEASRNKNKINSKYNEIHMDILNQVQEEGIVELQNSRLEQYKKQDETIESDIIEEEPKPLYTRRRKNI